MDVTLRRGGEERGRWRDTTIPLLPPRRSGGSKDHPAIDVREEQPRSDRGADDHDDGCTKKQLQRTIADDDEEVVVG